MREIVFDTETTGFEANKGDRLVEIGCVEMFNYIPTGVTFHVYVNPERDMPIGAFQVHGLSSEFLSDKPVFADIAQSFLDFVGESTLIAHNASFDMGFINAEIGRLGHPAITNERVIDTLLLARRKHPGASNKLDDLCARYGIDNSKRVKHGALLDAELLAEVYCELMGGRQATLGLSVLSSQAGSHRQIGRASLKRPSALPSRITPADRDAHENYVRSLGEKAIWQQYKDAGRET
jgi:DNA polymerase III subunit epsilon